MCFCSSVNSGTIISIIFCITPFKIFYFIIKWIFIFMINHWKIIWIVYKCFRH